jgi:hypothetical protein
MTYRILSLVLLAAAMWGGATLRDASAASAPESIMITEGEIKDRPFYVIGDISVVVKKVPFLDNGPLRVKANNALKEEAAKMGADAVTHMHYDASGLTFAGFTGHVTVSGKAIGFGTAPPKPVAAAAPAVAAPAPPSEPGVYSASTVRNYVLAVNAGTVSDAMAQFAEAAYIEDPVGSHVQQGRAAIEAYILGLIARGTQYEMVGSPKAGTSAAAVPVRVHNGTSAKSVVLTFTFAANGTITSLRSYAGE